MLQISPTDLLLALGLVLAIGIIIGGAGVLMIFPRRGSYY
jgi:hypothetical protein